jgi:hypothetical protein
MPKVKADYSDVSEQEGFDTYEGEAPKPGVYEAVLTSCAEHTSKAGNEGLRWVFEITEEGPFTGWPGFVYSNMETAAWKTKQITDALGWTDPDKKDKVQEWDSDRELKLGKRTAVKLQVTNKMFEGERRGEVKTVLKPGPGQKGRATKPRSTTEPSAEGEEGGSDGGPENDPF